jgi:hypothetical protein
MVLGVYDEYGEEFLGPYIGVTTDEYNRGYIWYADDDYDGICRPVEDVKIKRMA